MADLPQSVLKGDALAHAIFVALRHQVKTSEGWVDTAVQMAEYLRHCGFSEDRCEHIKKYEEERSKFASLTHRVTMFKITGRPEYIFDMKQENP